MSWLGHKFADGYKVASLHETREEARREATYYNRNRRGEHYRVRRIRKGLWAMVGRAK